MFYSASAEALDDQRQELTRRSQLEVERAREDERARQVALLVDAVDHLQKMESYLHARKLLDEASKKVSKYLGFHLRPKESRSNRDVK